jgi:hypothetical protein
VDGKEQKYENIRNYVCKVIANEIKLFSIYPKKKESEANVSERIPEAGVVCLFIFALPSYTTRYSSPAREAKVKRI